MAESIKNSAYEDPVVTHGDHPGIHLVQEYFDEHQPNYKWDADDNLTVFLHFREENEFTLKWVFQKFIIEYYRLARDTNVLTEETERVIEESPDPRFEISIDDIPAENFQVESEDELEGHTLISDEEPSPVYKKAVWGNGILIDEFFEIPGANGIASGEIILHRSPQRIHLQIEGKEDRHRILLTKLINWFSSNCSPAEILAVCNCPQCRQKPSHERYHLDYLILENLKLMYSPQVQCYKSGEMMPLDEISSIERPLVEVALIYDTDDHASAAKIKKMLKNRPISILFQDTNEILAGENVEEGYKEILQNCQFAIVLASADLVGGDESRLKWLEIAAIRYKKGEIAVALVEVRDCHWKDATLFKQWEPLNDSPPKKDEAWKMVGEKLYKKIEDWLHGQAIKYNK